MTVFRYKLINAQGKPETGIVDLPFIQNSDALHYLERQGGVVVSIKRYNVLLSKVINFLSNRKKVRRPALIEFFNNMHVMLASGIPVLSALDETIEENKHSALVMTLKFMRTDIESGQTFADAIAHHTKIFPQIALYLSQMGEETGNLDIMCEKIATHLTHIDTIIKATLRALIYPCVLLGVVLAVSLMWFYYVLPQLAEVFTELGVKIPLITRIVLGFSLWMKKYSLLVLFSVLLCIFLFFLLRAKVRRFRLFTDSLFLRLPIIKGIMETSIIARICEYLALLNAAGIGVIRTLEIINSSVGNLVYKYRITQTMTYIKNGGSLSDSIRQARAMPAFPLRMISVGEQSGRLAEQSEYVAALYRKKVMDMVSVLEKTMEPILIILFGSVFGIIAIALLLPIYDMVNQLQ